MDRKKRKQQKKRHRAYPLGEKDHSGGSANAECLRPRGKKLDSPVSSIPCQARDRLKQVYQVRNDRIFKVISGNIDNTKRARSCNIAFRVPLFKMY